MRKHRNIAHKINPTFAIVVDGETECWYLQMLKRNEKHIRINIEPKVPNKKSLEEQYNLVCNLLEREYTKVIWIIDLDVTIKETNEARKGKKTPLKVFEEYTRKLEKKNNVVVVVNNPCLEFWFLLHFEKTSKYFSTCLDAENQLKKYLENYEKTQRFFTKESDDIYLKLKPYLKSAIKNAVSLGNFNIQYPTKTISEMPLFFQLEGLKEHFK